MVCLERRARVPEPAGDGPGHPRGGIVRRDARPAQGAAGATRRGLPHHLAGAGGDVGGRLGPDDQDALRARRRAHGRGGRDALHGPDHPVHLIAGRLSGGVSVLRHGQVSLRPQPARARDRRAGDRRGAPARGRGPQAVACRLHGHGRAVRQLPGRHRLGAQDVRPRPPGHQPAPDRALDQRRDPAHRAARRREAAGDAGDLAARGTRRAARRAGPDQPQVSRGQPRRRRAGLRREERASREL